MSQIDLKALQAEYPGCTTFKFGDSESLCQQLISLVRSGKKRATCGSLREYEAEGESIPSVGQIEIAQNWDGSPALVLEITEVSLTKFCDVRESFALAEGEDETLAGWQAGHQTFFERNGGFEPEMMLVCLRFEVVQDFE